MEFEKRRNLIFVNSSPKSWVIGIDIASNLKKKGENVQIILLGRSPTTRPRVPWPPRVLYQRKLVSELELHTSWLRWRFSGKILSLFLHAFRIFRQTMMCNVWTNDLRTVRAQLAALYGSSEIQPRLTSKLKLFRLILIRSLIQSKLSRNFQDNGTNIDCIWVFNGREILESSVLEWALQQGIQTKIFERGSTSNKYEVYEMSPHFNNEWWQKIENFHNALSAKECISDSGKILDFMSKKSQGVDPFMSQKWQEFADFEEFNIPYDWKPFVCFFSVSTGEFSPFVEFESVGGFTNQFLALNELLMVCKELGHRVVVRRHPNSLGIDRVDREQHLWRPFLRDTDIIYLGPTAKVNSYSLAKGAVCSFTWRSTIGFDLLSRGLPAFAMGPAKWALTDEVKAYDAASIRKFIKNPTITAEAKAAVHNYAHYFATFGSTLEEFNYVERWGFQTNFKKRYRYYLH